MERNCPIFQKDGSCPRFFQGECRSSHPPACQHKNECHDEKCRFLHERGWCRFGKACSKADCIFRHPRQCKYGANCKNKNKDCVFRHLGGERPHAESPKTDKVVSSISSTSQSSNDERLVDQLSASMAKIVKEFDSKSSKLKLTLSKFQTRESSRSNGSNAAKLVASFLDVVRRQRETGQLTWLRLVSNAPKMTPFELSYAAWREMYRLRNPRHILSKRIDIERVVENNRVTLICGDYASGKSTQIPQYLADHPTLDMKGGKFIYHLSVSDLEAECLAERIAPEFASGNPKLGRIGLSAGVLTPHVSKTSKYTKIICCSYLHFFKLITSADSKILTSAGCIVMDDVHLRVSYLDLVLGWINHYLNPKDQPRIVLLSAQSPAENPHVAALKPSASIMLNKPSFPVRIINKHCGYTTAAITDAVVRLAQEVLASAQRSRGHIICFLPSKDEVDIAAFNFSRALRAQPDDNARVNVLTIHSKQIPYERTDLRLKSSNLSSVIFTDSSAELSQGIIGPVSCVIDCGFNYRLVESPFSGQHRLQLSPISQAEAEVRSSIVSSFANGYCYRLYSGRDLQKCPAVDSPRIMNGHLPGACFHLINLDISPTTFPWLEDYPKPADVDKALDQLEVLNFITKDSTFSSGFKASESISPVVNTPELFYFPSVAALMARAVCVDKCSVGADLAALMLLAHDILYRGSSDRDGTEQAAIQKSREPFLSSESDIITLYRIYKQWITVRDGSVTLDETVSEFDAESAVDPNESIKDDINIIDNSDDDDDADDYMDDSKSVASSSTTSTATSTVDMEPKFDASDIDSLSAASDIGMNPREEYEADAAEDKRALSGHLRRWCKENFINNSALRRVVAVSRDILRLVSRDREKQQTATDEELRQLVFSGSISNLSVHVGGGRFKSILLGSIGPINPLSSVAASKEVPKWIVWQNNYRGTLCDVTVADEKWVADYPLAYARSRDLDYASVLTFDQVPVAVLNLIFGRNMSQKDDIVRLIGCKLDVDFERNTITAFCPSKNAEDVRSNVNRLIREQKAALEAEILEEKYLGQTRCVYGAGGEIIDILTGEDVISVEIRDFAQDFDISAMKQTLELDGFKFRKFETRASPANMGKMSAFATCENARQAKELVRAYPEWKPSRQQSEFRQVKTEILISWANGPLTGKMFLTFATYSEANAFIVAKLYPSCHAIGFDPADAEQRKQKARLPKVHHVRKATLFSDMKPKEASEYKHFKVKVNIEAYKKNITEDTVREELARRGFAPLDIVLPRAEAPEETLPELLLEVKPADAVSWQPWEDEYSRRAGIIYQMPSWESATHFRASASAALLSDLGAIRFSQPCGIALSCRSSMAISAGLWNLYQDTTGALMGALRRLGVVPRAHNINAHKVVISLMAMDVEALNKAMKQIEQTFTFSPFRHRKNQLLFTDFGRFKLFRLSDANPVIQIDTRTRSIRLYRSQNERNVAAASLEALIGELEDLELDHAFIIRRSARFQVSQDIPLLQRKSGVLDLKMMGNRLIASGEQSSIETLRELIKNAIVAPRSSSSNAGSVSEGDCPICYESLSEVESVTMIGCDHSFCKQCVQDFLSQPSLPVPVTCPLGAACKRPMFLHDLMNLASAESLEKVKQLALEHYLIEKQTFMHCVKEGCDQVLQIPQVGNLEKQQLEKGGIGFFCDECDANYCYACSVKMQQPLLVHRAVNCIENRSRLNTTVLGRLNYIRNEILMSACPRCKKAFLDFDGCCAVTCSAPCGAAFCGFCLDDCGKDAHAHVKKCELNPNPGSYFGTHAEIRTAQGAVKRRRLLAYLDEVANKDDLITILRDIEKDLVDLGIKPVTAKELGK